ncbi:transposase [Gammaproteobacteria bacterium]
MTNPDDPAKPMTAPVADIQLMRFDWAIKTILRDKANFDVLEGFLSALLDEDIIIEQVLESESNTEEGLKFNRVDLLVHDHLGRKVIVEVQNDREMDYLERLLFGTAKVVVDNLPLGEAYLQIVKVISISILYFNLGVGDDYVYKGITEFKGLHNGQPLNVRRRVKIPDATFSYQPKNVFPEYYLINVKRFEDVIQSPLDEWIYLLKHSAVRADFHARHIDKAAQKLALLRMSPEERRRYERYLDSMVIERSRIETARDEGLRKGRQEGHQEGLEEGIAEGEHRRALVVARELKALGLPMAQIAAITGLTLEEVP